MSEGWISKKIFFQDLQVGDIVSDNQYKHLSEVLAREEHEGYVAHRFAGGNQVNTARSAEILVHVHRKQVTNG